jgi:hypothetical protein
MVCHIIPIILHKFKIFSFSFSFSF